MPIYLTINHYGDSLTGHANVTLSGSIDGVQYEALTVGSNTGPDANWQDILGSFFGGGVLRDEGSSLTTRNPTSYTIEIDSAYASEWQQAYNDARYIVENGSIPHDYDLLGLFSNGTNCIEFVNEVSSSLGVNILDHVSITELNKTYAGGHFLNYQIPNLISDMGINVNSAFAYDAYGGFKNFLLAYEAVHGEGSLSESLIRQMV